MAFLIYFITTYSSNFVVGWFAVIISRNCRGLPPKRPWKMFYTRSEYRPVPVVKTWIYCSIPSWKQEEYIVPSRRIIIFLSSRSVVPTKPAQWPHRPAVNVIRVFWRWSDGWQPLGNVCFFFLFAGVCCHWVSTITSRITARIPRDGLFASARTFAPSGWHPLFIFWYFDPTVLIGGLSHLAPRSHGQGAEILYCQPSAGSSRRRPTGTSIPFGTMQTIKIYNNSCYRLHVDNRIVCTPKFELPLAREEDFFRIKRPRRLIPVSYGSSTRFSSIWCFWLIFIDVFDRERRRKVRACASRNALSYICTISQVPNEKLRLSIEVVWNFQHFHKTKNRHQINVEVFILPARNHVTFWVCAFECYLLDTTNGNTTILKNLILLRWRNGFFRWVALRWWVHSSWEVRSARPICPCSRSKAPVKGRTKQIELNQTQLS